ncbi:hypothetical protein HYH03_004838 [Edaphochlamys debaryana]|uniref:Uncharacterized protein n=1 Tax=Edaphochlamys debaryana TaxID=47281 RepID=A0A835YGN3_9CHLO|nr:hypothetical protein HYH03_004838 [Edaphochlamys debaryana]|eukprot:KAG2497254.1 hypothetical protein HYH03_004838 [Edaphochlamys debaryana]
MEGGDFGGDDFETLALASASARGAGLAITKSINTARYSKAVTAKAKAGADFLNPEALLQKAFQNHRKNIEHLTDVSVHDIRTRSFNPSLIRLQAESYIGKHLPDALLQDDEEDEDEYSGQAFGKSSPPQAVATPQQQHEATVVSDMDSDDDDDAGSAVQIHRILPADDDGCSSHGMDSDCEEPPRGEGVSALPAPLAPRPGSRPDSFRGSQQLPAISMSSLTEPPGSPGGAGSASGGSASVSGAVVEGRRAESLISQLRQFQRSGGAGPSYLTGDVSVRAGSGNLSGGNSPLDPSTRGGRFLSPTPPAASPVKDGYVRPGYPGGSMAGPEAGSAAGRVSDLKSPTSPTSPHGPAASGGSFLEPSVRAGRLGSSSIEQPERMRREGVSSLNGGAGLAVKLPSAAGVFGGPRPPLSPGSFGGPGSGPSGSTPVQIRGTSEDKSVYGRRLNGAGPGGAQGVGSPGSAGAISPASVPTPKLNEPSVRGGWRNGGGGSGTVLGANVRAASTSQLGLGGGGGGAGGGPARTMALLGPQSGPITPLDAAERDPGSPYGYATSAGPGAAGGAGSPAAADSPPPRHPAANLFKAITGAAPVGRGSVEPGLSVDASAKSMRPSQAALLQQQLLAEGVGGAGKSRRGAPRHASTSQLEVAIPGSPTGAGASSMRLPKLPTNAGGAPGSPGASDAGGLFALPQTGGVARPSGLSRGLSSSLATAPGLSAAGSPLHPSRLSSCPGGDAEEGPGLVSKVKGLFGMLHKHK